jgi:hypothetical protein
MHVYVRKASGHEPRQRVTGVLREDAPTLAEAALCQAPIHDGRPFPPNLEAHHPDPRVHGQALEQKATSTRADLELHEPSASRHERARIEGLAFRQARSIGVGTNLHV